MTAKRAKGQMAYHDGHAAEDRVAAVYIADGHREVARRWRGGGSEIDLIFRKGGEVIFVEVKKATTLARAAERLSTRQLQRIFRAATVFLAGEPMGDLTPMRVDLAMVDGMGRHEILENIQLG